MSRSGLRLPRVPFLSLASCLLAAALASAQPAPLKTWYLAEGTTHWQFEEFVLIANPNGAAVDARVTFLRPPVMVSGQPQRQPDIVHTYRLPATSRKTIRVREVAELAGVATDISVVVECLAPGATAACAGDGIVVERSMYWPRSSGGAASTWLAGHNSMGQSSAARRWYLAEGATSIFDEYILLTNPSTTATAHVRLTFQNQAKRADGTPYAPFTLLRDLLPGTRTNVVPRGSLELPAELQYASFSVEIDSDVPILTERSMYWPTVAADLPIAWRGGHESGAVPSVSLTWNFAEGYSGTSPGGQNFETYLLIENPDQTRKASVRITYYLNQSTITENVVIDPQTRFTRWANGVQGLASQSFGILVVSDVPVVSERAMYWGTQPSDPAQWSALNWLEGHDSPGVPVESSKWCFAEGTAENGFQTYFLLRNASARDTTVKFTFMLEDESAPGKGAGATATFQLKANSRQTISLDQFPPSIWGKRFATFVESVPDSGPAVPFVAERAMYWGSDASWLGGHASAGTPWPDAGVIGAPGAPSPASPTVASVSPSQGPMAGGTTVTIRGTNFAWPTVTIGGAPATSVTTAIGDSQAISAVVPAHAFGAVDVVVTNKDGRSVTLANGYIYLGTPPTIDTVSPAVGLPSGGTTITIRGAFFQAGATVTVGGAAATNVTVVDSTRITARTPGHAEGTVDVVVTNPDATSATRSSSFTYGHYLAFGDSITAGWMVDSAGFISIAFPLPGNPGYYWLGDLVVPEPAPYPQRLSNLLSIQVDNEGAPGERTSAGTARIGGAMKASHAAVILVEGTNDASEVQRSDPGSKVAEVVANLRRMADAARADGKAVVLATLPPSLPIQVTDGSTPPFEQYHAAELWQIQAVNSGIRSLIGELSADPGYADAFVGVDLYAAFGGDNPDRALLCPDGLHPSVAGYNRIADAIFNALPASWK